MRAHYKRWRADLALDSRGLYAPCTPGAAARPYRAAAMLVSSLAVLPFRAEGGGRAELVARGLPALIAEMCASSLRCRIVPWATSSVMPDDETPDSIGRVLHVDAVLTGSVAATARAVDVTLELIAPIAERTLATWTYAVVARELPVLLHRIARELERGFGVDVPAARAWAAVDPLVLFLYMEGRLAQIAPSLHPLHVP